MRWLVLVLLVSCTPGAKPAETPPRAVVDAEVSRVLDAWHDTAARADEDGYFAHFAWCPRPDHRGDEDLDSAGLGAVRGSGVLVRDPRSGSWKIAQYNLSVPIPNDEFPAVKALIER